VGALRAAVRQFLGVIECRCHRCPLHGADAVRREARPFQYLFRLLWRRARGGKALLVFPLLSISLFPAGKLRGDRLHAIPCKHRKLTGRRAAMVAGDPVIERPGNGPLRELRQRLAVFLDHRGLFLRLHVRLVIQPQTTSSAVEDILLIHLRTGRLDQGLCRFLPHRRGGRIPGGQCQTAFCHGVLR